MIVTPFEKEDLVYEIHKGLSGPDKNVKVYCCLKLDDKVEKQKLKFHGFAIYYLDSKNEKYVEAGFNYEGK